jgi:hypothetical protein
VRDDGAVALAEQQLVQARDGAGDVLHGRQLRLGRIWMQK